MMENNLLAMLRIHGAVSELTDDEVLAIIKRGTFQDVRADETVMHAGTAVDAIYLVLRGRLRMEIQANHSGVQTIRHVTAGDQFGALALISNMPYPANVVASEACMLFRLETADALALSQQIPSLQKSLLQGIGQSVKAMVMRSRRPKLPRVIWFVDTGRSSEIIVAELARQMQLVGERVIAVAHEQSSLTLPTDVETATISSDRFDQTAIHETIGQFQHYDRIFVMSGWNELSEHFPFAAEICDLLLVVSRTQDHAPCWDLARTSIHGGHRDKLRFVWALAPDELACPFVADLEQFYQRDFKVSLPSPQGTSRLFSQAVQRIVHELRGIKIGVALGGGAAFGMAHLGVLKAFEESGIAVDLIVGTSAGALTSMPYAFGMSADYCVDRFTEDLTPGAFFQKLPAGDGLYLLRQFRTHSWDKMLRKYLFDWRIEQAQIPIRTVTTDLVAGQQVVRDRGDATHAILESINLPGVSKPIARDGKLLVDGGVVNNLPADVLLKEECDLIIGVDVVAKINRRFAADTTSTGLVNTILRCIQVQAHSLGAVGAAPAHVLLTPDVSQFEATSFSRTPELAAIGYECALNSVPTIRALAEAVSVP